MSTNFSPPPTLPADCRKLLVAAKRNNWPNTISAIDMAIFWHHGQKRRSGGDAVTHPARVAYMLYALGVLDDVIIAAALLHDVLEDTTATSADLASVDDEVLLLVQLLTKQVGITDAEYFAQIRSSPKASLIKLADRAHNIATMRGAMTHERMHSYIRETRTYVQPLWTSFPRNHHLANTADNLQMAIEANILKYENLLGNE